MKTNLRPHVAIQQSTISRLRTKYRDWRLQAYHKRMSIWERTRAQGKGRFVLTTTFTLTVLMSGIRLVHYYKDGTLADNALFAIVQYFFTGFFVSLFIWAQAERTYRRYLSEQSQSYAPSARIHD